MLRNHHTRSMINRLTGFIISCVLFIATHAQLPDTDIFLWRLDTLSHKISLRDPLNITAEKGYQNQPCFSNDGQMIYYTSQCDTCSKTTIYSYSISSKEKKEVIVTSMSPYSAMPAPVAHAITAVTVEPDSSQRIWQYSLENNQAVALFPFRDSVGYYTWINDHAVIAYILGSSPGKSRLSLLTNDGKEKILATNIGRGMKSVGNGALFIQHVDSINYLAWTDLSSTTTLIKTAGNSEDLAILGNDILMAGNSTIYAAKMNIENGKLKSVEAFCPLADLSKYGIQNITRIAVSPLRDNLALVANGH